MDQERRPGPFPAPARSVIEAKNQVDSERQYIFKKEAEQLGHHVTWFKQEYPDGAHTAILIHPSATLYDDAYIPIGSKVL